MPERIPASEVGRPDEFEAKTFPVSDVFRCFSYDPATGGLFWRQRDDVGNQWNAKHAGKRAGSKHPKGVYVRLNVAGRPESYAAHRLVWVLMTGVWPPGVVDHADRDQYNNRWSNLRLATVGQNNSNVHRIRGAVPYKGVHFNQVAKKFKAQISVKARRIGLGAYETAEQAAAAYDEAATKYHGDFAVTNESLGLLGGEDGA